MTVYYSIDEAINSPRIPRELTDSLTAGMDEFCKHVHAVIQETIKEKKRACFLAFDGYLGVDWEHIISRTSETLKKKGLELKIVDIASQYKSPSKVKEIIDPCLESDHDFGFVFSGKLERFFDFDRLKQLKQEFINWKRKSLAHEPIPSAVICYGSGAAVPFLMKLYDHVFYFDLGRERIFNAAEEKRPSFLGYETESHTVYQFIREFYYVYSQILNKQKKYILKHMDCYVECNDPQEPKLVPKKAYDGILSIAAGYPLKIKPLYYPVSWGGTWLKKTKKLPQSMKNSGQGFLVASENCVRIATNKFVLEVPFINFLWKEPADILGSRVAEKFKGEFPLTYWYDDGIGGGSMAIQVHANGAYMKRTFNEPIRQDESYYILHTGPGAKTYLGLTEEADVNEFRDAAEKARKEGIPFDHDKYVDSIPTKPGDYFLIPAGTVHASGRNQVVLEIDGGIAAYASGYTFHIYDYLRPDLDGTLRSIHLNHSFNVLRKNRRRSWVFKNLKQHPMLVRKGVGWSEHVIGSLDGMYYETYRLEFETKIEDNTQGRFHMLTLVEGESATIQSKKDPEKKVKFRFPDTIIVPACVGNYLLTNLGNGPCKIVKALIR